MAVGAVEKDIASSRRQSVRCELVFEDRKIRTGCTKRVRDEPS